MPCTGRAWPLHLGHNKYIVKVLFHFRTHNRLSYEDFVLSIANISLNLDFHASAVLLLELNVFKPKTYFMYHQV